LTQAPGYDKYHTDKDTPDGIWNTIHDLLSKHYPVGSATVNVEKTNEVSGHAYSILGAYEVILLNGKTEKLIRMYNPWNREVWLTNPWSDNSSNWTESVKAQVPYVDANDGIFYVCAADYLANFGVTNWAELRDDYDVTFQDIATKDVLEQDINYTTVFTYTPNNNLSNLTFYVLIDTSDTRLNLGCDNPFDTIDLKVITPTGTILGLDIYGYNVKVANATAGNYTVTATVIKHKDYVKYFTITIYGPESQSVFFPLANNYIVYRRIDCLNDCSDHGDCNNYNGKCICDFGVIIFFSITLNRFFSGMELIAQPISQIRQIMLLIRLAMERHVHIMEFASMVFF